MPTILLEAWALLRRFWWVIPAVLLFVMLFIWGPAACNKIRGLEQQTKIDRGQIEASHQSGSDAVNTVGTVASNQMQSEDLTRSNEKEIRNAQGANDAVNPAVRDAGLRALCRRKASAHDPKCRVLQPTS